MAPNCEKYIQKLTVSLNELRKLNQLCDVVINVGGIQFPAHKAVLAASSSYFMAMFTSGYKESTQNEIKIDGNADAFAIILEFVYTGHIKSVELNLAYPLLELACYLQYTDVSELCSNQIKLNNNEAAPSTSSLISISMEDVFKMYHLAEMQNGLKPIMDECMLYMCDRIQELKETEEFLQSGTATFLKKYLNEEDLASADQEIEVLDLLMKWLQHDWEDRRTHALSFLQSVRLGLVPEEKLRQLLDDQVCQIQECKKLVEDVLRQIASGMETFILAEKSPELFTTRSTITAPLLLSEMSDEKDYIGIRTSLEYQFEYFHLDKKSWIVLSEVAMLPHMALLFVAENKLYAMVAQGAKGADRFGLLNVYDFYEYNITQNNWIKLCPTLEHHELRKSLVLYMDGSIYIMDQLNMERYIIDEKRWEQLASIPESYYKRMCAVIYQGRILVYGVSVVGSVPWRYTILEYNPDSNKWEIVCSEPDSIFTCLTRPVLFVCKDQLYRVGHDDAKFPVVHRLIRENGRMKIGKEIRQQNGIFEQGTIKGVFCIEGQLFVKSSYNEFVLPTDIQLNEDTTDNIDVFEVKKCNKFVTKALKKDHSNVTMFTFDRKRLGGTYLTQS